MREGHILDYQDVDGGTPFADEVEMAGYDIEDHCFPPPDPPMSGLLIFEGWVQVGPGLEPDITIDGLWRPLTHWEMCRVRFGRTPWEE